MTGQVLIVPPYFDNLGKRLVKSPKVYIADSGMACHLLGIAAGAIEAAGRDVPRARAVARAGPRHNAGAGGARDAVANVRAGAVLRRAARAAAPGSGVARRRTSARPRLAVTPAPFRTILRRDPASFPPQRRRPSP
ncbi:MAG TPA: DUF4143 domain-containing protein [Planctomycetota bacterium]|nr:DUF4143 domain-containing protein [Planctomycetota bacterium]